MAHVGIMTSGGNLCASQKIPKALRRQENELEWQHVLACSAALWKPRFLDRFIKYIIWWKKRDEKEKLGCSEANPKKCVLTKASESSDRGVLVAHDYNNNHGVLY